MMRVFLVGREMPPLLADLGLTEPPPSRQDYLLSALAGEIRFQHRKRPFVYKAFHEIERQYIAAVIAREHTVEISLPPEREFRAAAVPDWETANVFIDTSGDENGQRVAMQHAAIGEPLAILRSLTDHINATNKDADWSMAVNAISDGGEFWAAAARYEGNISELDMTFVTPNIWRGVSEVEKGLKELKQENNAEEVEIKLKNHEKNLVADTPRIRNSVDYISKGGGSLQIKSGGNVVFSSEQTVATENVEDDPPVQEAEQSTVSRVVNWLFRR